MAGLINISAFLFWSPYREIYELENLYCLPLRRIFCLPLNGVDLTDHFTTIDWYTGLHSSLTHALARRTDRYFSLVGWWDVKSRSTTFPPDSKSKWLRITWHLEQKKLPGRRGQLTTNTTNWNKIGKETASIINHKGNRFSVTKDSRVGIKMSWLGLAQWIPFEYSN